MDGRRPGFIQRALGPCGRRDFISRPSVGVESLQSAAAAAAGDDDDNAGGGLVARVDRDTAQTKSPSTTKHCSVLHECSTEIPPPPHICPRPNTRHRPPRGRETICPAADGSSARGGSTSVRGRVRSPHISGGRRWLSCRQPACL